MKSHLSSNQVFQLNPVLPWICCIPPDSKRVRSSTRSQPFVVFLASPEGSRQFLKLTNPSCLRCSYQIIIFFYTVRVVCIRNSVNVFENTWEACSWTWPRVKEWKNEKEPAVCFLCPGHQIDPFSPEIPPMLENHYTDNLIWWDKMDIQQNHV